MSSGYLGNSVRPTGDRLLILLKTRGPQTAAHLGKVLGITGEAARQQLNRLAGEDLVIADTKPLGVGRPAQVWSLTEAGHARFPDAHAEVTLQLIDAIRAEFGEEALQRLITNRARDAQKNYETAMSGARNLGERVAKLAEIRTREGYMAEMVSEGEEYLLIENHCPICVAATACQGFCHAELDTFRRVLGPDVAIERTEHIVQGDRRCVYRISRTSPPEK